MYMYIHAQYHLSQPQNLQFKTALFCLLFLELLALLSARYPSFLARFPSSDVVSHAIDITRVPPHCTSTSLHEPRPLVL